MKLRKKTSVENESYWKSFTDIMAGLVLVILLILMLLLLLLTQMNDEEHTEDYQYETYYEEHLADDYDRYRHEFDHENENTSNDSGGGGGGGGDGVDDPGTSENDGIYIDVGHDKTAVFVTVIDEETKNVIKKEGILFELYASRNAGGLMALHTYYPDKVEYKQYQTTEAGTFFLPEKITQGTYSLHNLESPEGYGLAQDVSFTIDEARDWSDPFLVDVPMSPAKSIIYIQNVDAQTNENVGGSLYEVYAAEDVVTLDGTVRYRNGEKVDEFACDENGRGQSIQLYLGKYTVMQKIPAEYYALNRTPVAVTLDYLENDSKTYTVKCEKTRAEFILRDEYTEEPIKGAVYSITDKEEQRTDADGKITITDLNKSTSYSVALKSVPKPYRISTEPLTFTVDGNGCIDGNAALNVSQTAYIIRLSVDIKDMVFSNSVTGNRIKLFDSSDNVVEEWEASGEAYQIEGLEPGVYYLEINGRKSSDYIIDLKDVGTLQKLETKFWTMWDTVSAALAAALFALLVFVIVRIIRRIGKKKENE
ncbi:MAG: hypothetical protein IJH32_09960 [Ruminococcus sp.]|nr:hypothetical protein [Ruminococcus sp.]